MNIELKNLHIYPRFSEETLAFTASLYIDGRKVGYAENKGCGGMTTYGADHHDNFELIKQAEKYCEQLPPNRFTYEGVKYENPSNLEVFIDRIVDDAWQRKQQSKKHKI